MLYKTIALKLPNLDYVDNFVLCILAGVGIYCVVEILYHFILPLISEDEDSWDD